MTHKQPLLALLLGTLVVPAVALAQTSPDYITPEDVLLNGNAFPSIQTSGQYATMTNEEIVAAQQSSAAARRKAELDANYAAQHPAAPSEASQASEVSSKDQLQEMTDLINAIKGNGNTGPLSDEQLRAQRTLNRVQQHQFQMQAGSNAQVLASQQSLHGGAPLASSGPGTIVALLLLAGAAGWTFYRARELEAKD